MVLIPPHNIANIMQTLGAIVQAYASILAIMGAFYIFVIEGMQVEFRKIEDRIDENIRKLYLVVELESQDLADSIKFRSVKKESIDWLTDQLTRPSISAARSQRMLNSEPYLTLEDDIPKYKTLQNKTKMIAFNKLRILLGMSCSMLILPFVLMYIYSLENLSYNPDIFYICTVIIAIIGVPFFLWYVIRFIRMK